MFSDLVNDMVDMVHMTHLYSLLSWCLIRKLNLIPILDTDDQKLVKVVPGVQNLSLNMGVVNLLC